MSLLFMTKEIAYIKYFIILIMWWAYIRFSLHIECIVKVKISLFYEHINSYVLYYVNYVKVYVLQVLFYHNLKYK